MTPITQAETFQLIREEREKVHHIDEEVDDIVFRSKLIYFVKFQDAERFLALIWAEEEGARILAPPGQPQTLQDAANRMIYNDWTFDDLNEDMGLPRHIHDPEMFGKARYLDENFNYDELGLIILAPSTEEERERSPRGTFYIYDGWHRSIALAKRLLMEEEDYEPVQGIMVIPRPL